MFRDYNVQKLKNSTTSPDLKAEKRQKPASKRLAPPSEAARFKAVACPVAASRDCTLRSPPHVARLDAGADSGHRATGSLAPSPYPSPEP